MTNIDPKKLGNEIDAVAKKKLSLNLYTWVYAVALLGANLVGVFLHI